MIEFEVRKIWIYIISAFILGLSHNWLKISFNTHVSLGIVISYAILLRFVAEKYGK